MVRSQSLTPYLLLGRVSNLPTVWTNTLAGATLAGAAVTPGRLVLLAAAFSLLYTGGMYLNDAFDREVDARERPERPISDHLEVETYTWDVLPERYRATPVAAAIARELGWVRQQLDA